MIPSLRLTTIAYHSQRPPYLLSGINAKIKKSEEDSVIRIISARKATQKESQQYQG